MASKSVTTPAAAAPVKVSKKKTASSAKTKKVASHPTYAEMIKDALTNLKERGGSSRVAVLKYIMKKYQLGQDEKLVNAHLKLALRSGIKNGSLKQSKGTGATGSFRVGAAEKQTKPGRKPKAAGAKKPKVAKKPKAEGSATKTKKPKKMAAAKEGSAKKLKVAKKPQSPTKTVKPAAAKKPKATKAAKPKTPKVLKPKVVKSKVSAK